MGILLWQQSSDCRWQRKTRAVPAGRSPQELWHGSNYLARREILDILSSNHALSSQTLYLSKRKPFDLLAEGPSLVDGRVHQRLFEPLARQFAEIAILSGELQRLGETGFAIFASIDMQERRLAPNLRESVRTCGNIQFPSLASA